MDKNEIEQSLDFFLFDGDFGEQGDTELSNKIVKGRKEYECFICKNCINKGEFHRVTTWKFYNELLTYRCCNTCCLAMIKSINCDYDEDDPIDLRYKIGDENRNKNKKKKSQEKS
jgi:hypothetical protein